MADKNALSQDQLTRIEATLMRIRAGLKRDQSPAFEEPAHQFKPEAYHEKEK